MKLSCRLMWAVFQVSCALEGPKTVSEPIGGSLRVQCKYGNGDEEFVKYWCKEESFRLCSVNNIVRTTGSETEVKRKRMSIKDNHTLHEFTVIMKNISKADAGVYLCGIEKSYDIWHPVEVIITTVSTSLNHVRNKKHKIEETSGVTTTAPERIQHNNLDFLLLIILKIAIFLVMIAAVIWVHVWYRTGRSTHAEVRE